MNAKTRIKVSRDALVAKIKANDAAAQAEFVADTAAYEKAAKAYVFAVADFLKATAVKVRSGEVAAKDVFSSSYHGYLYDNQPDRPDKPRTPSDRSVAIAQLEMSTEEAITITAEDFSRYMTN